jgi:Ser/Thr protein kinase RdoA (MazF antagonist)
MEPRIKDRYHDGILQEALHRYGIASENIHLLDGFESFIYEFERDSGDYILRIGHSLRKSVALVQGEIDWINYLAEGGVGVSRAIPSHNGLLVEQINDGRGEYFLVTAFVKAKGVYPDEAGWSANLYQRYGRAVGKMHALTKDYVPGNPAWKRPEWDGDLADIPGWLPETETVAVEKFHRTVAHLRSLPTSPDSYGLIHQDAHGINFFVDENRNLTFFDFDDCLYGWFAYDIAIVLFYKAMWAEDPAAYTQEFMTHFLRGYRQENKLDPIWLREFPHFLKLREIDTYAVIHRSFDVDNLVDPWNVGYMRGRKERIDNDVPVIDFDFETLADAL